MKDLIVSETFFSLQGEGFTSGVPAVFLRTASCNLTCRGWSFKNAAGETLGCDTTEVWQKGVRYSADALVSEFELKEYASSLRSGAHLIITGGEPLLRQVELAAFLELLMLRLQKVPNQHPHDVCYVEVETNGTIMPVYEFSKFISQWNVSPKLQSGGDSFDLRYKPDVLKHLSSLSTSYFKFVITHPSDVDEVTENYIHRFNIPQQRVCFMPEGGTSERLKETGPMVAELCKKYCIRYSDRLQVRIWEKTTGV